MKNKLFSGIIFMACLMLYSCSKKNKSVIAPSSTYDIETPSSGLDENTVNQKNPNEIPELSKVYRVVTIQKTGCYGNCPDYEFILQSNGDATYIGKKNVPRIGKYLAKAQPGFLFSIKDQIQKGNFFKMSTIYPTNEQVIEDLPDTYIMVSDNIHQIIIRNNHDAPRELIDFQNELEGMIEKLDWKKK